MNKKIIGLPFQANLVTHLFVSISMSSFFPARAIFTPEVNFEKLLKEKSVLLLGL